MNSVKQLSYFLKAPDYPVIVDIDGVLVAASSARPLYKKLSRLDIPKKGSYTTLDANGQPWTLIVKDGHGVLSPLNPEKPPTKLELIRWFNNRKNRPAKEIKYSERSLSAKRRDRIFLEIADRLLDAEKRHAPRPG